MPYRPFRQNKVARTASEFTDVSKPDTWRNLIWRKEVTCYSQQDRIWAFVFPGSCGLDACGGATDVHCEQSVQ